MSRPIIASVYFISVYLSISLRLSDFSIMPAAHLGVYESLTTAPISPASIAATS